MRHLINDDELVQGRQRAIKHWQKVMENPSAPAMSKHYAREALKQLGHPWREPGEDE